MSLTLARSGPNSSSSEVLAFQYRHVVRHSRAAHIEDQPEAGVRQLQFAGLAGELAIGDRMHGYAGRADRVALGFEPAR